MNWTEAALSRGAIQGTYKRRPALLLPVGNNSRVIYLDGHLPKYGWIKAGEQQPLLINPAALDTPGEILYIANGDKSTYAHIGIGLENTIGRYGENQKAQIQRIVEAILNSHKRHIIIIPDCDDTGTKDAWYWKQYGTTAGLTVEIRDLRQHPLAAPKWDTRDLIELDYDLALDRLDCLPPFDFDLYPDELPSEASGNILDLFKPDYRPSEAASDSLYRQWWETEVLPKVAAAAPRGIHKPQQCRSGLHKHGDKRPSFRIIPGSLVPICHCKSFTHAEVAALYNAISYDAYREQHQNSTKTAPEIDLSGAPDNLGLSESEAAPLVGLGTIVPNGMIYNALPELIRAAGVKVKHTAFMRLLDILLGAGYQPGQVITIPEITPALAPYFSDRGIAKAVNSNFCTFVNTKKNKEKDYSLQKCKNSKRGRKAVEYLLPSIPDLAKAYGVSDGYLPPLPLPTAALESNKTYAAHAMRDIVLPSGIAVKKSGRKIAEEMAVSPATVSTYRKILEAHVPGFEVTPTPPHKEEITVDGIGDKLIAALDKAKEYGTTVWLEAADENRQPLNHLKKQKFNPDGTPKEPNNKFPLALGVVTRFAEDVAHWFICWKQPNTWYNPARPERSAALIRFNQFNNPLPAPMSNMAAAD